MRRPERRFALLQESHDTFLEIGAARHQGKRQRFVVEERFDIHPARSVDEHLGKAQRQSRPLRALLGECASALERIALDHLLGDAETEHVLRPHDLSGERKLLGASGPHCLLEQIQRTAIGHDADLSEDRRESRFLGGEHHVARENEGNAAPAAKPLTAPMSGFSNERSFSMNSFEERRASSTVDAHSSPDSSSETSPPAQNALPFPVRTTARTPSSKRKSSNACESSPNIWELSGLSFSGLFNETIAMEPRFSRSIVS